MQVTITINCDNAAFEDYPETEVARILRELADQSEDIRLFEPGACIPCFDINGNDVGSLIVRE